MSKRTLTNWVNPKSKINKKIVETGFTENQNIKQQSKAIKNLPSTIVREDKPSKRNSFIVLFLITCIFIAVWLSRSYGIDTFVLIDFYIRELIFNLNLIVSDLAKIIYTILN